MSRMIKVRAWSKAQDRYIDINGLSIGFGTMTNKGCVYGITEQGVLREYDVSEIDIELWTGLKDKNGKEHYCDDIFDIGQTVNGQSKFVIVNCIGRFDVRYAYDLSKRYEYDIDELLDLRNDQGCTYEVIGNIHENPELLK